MKNKVTIIAIIFIVLMFLPNFIWNNSKASDDNSLDSWVDLKWTYSSVEKKEGTTKELNELLTYNKPEDLGTILFYSDGTYRVTKPGPITDIIEKDAQSIEYSSVGDKMTITSGENTYVFQFDQNKNALVQNFDITVDGVKYEYILTMKYTTVITFSEAYCKALEGEWVVNSITKEKGTTKEFNAFVNYNTYEDLGTITLNNDTTYNISTYSIKKGTFFDDEKEDYYQGDRTYKILADKITLRRGGFPFQEFYYNEETGNLEMEYYFEEGAKYKITLKKVEKKNNIDNEEKNDSKQNNVINSIEDKQDNTAAKGQLPKAGKVNGIVFLSAFLVLLATAIIAYKNKDIK